MDFTFIVTQRPFPFWRINMTGKPIEYIESSFLSPLLKRGDITDISFNGESLYYASNIYGREKAEINPLKEEVGDFLRQIANLTERQFSVICPILDVSFGRYRLNAVNSSLSRNKNEKTFTFSLRIESSECVISEEDTAFFDKEAKEILLDILNKGESIVIGGITSSGKTELQKWLLLHMKPATRVIVIDNVEEIDMVTNDNIDLSTWLVRDEKENFARLIKNALRNNPDYIVIAEARGEEMLDALTSAMSGHPIITTVHAKDIFSLPKRLARLAMLGNERLYREELLDDIAHHIRYYIYVEKRSDPIKGIKRFISMIGKIDEKTKEIEILYQRKEGEK